MKGRSPAPQKPASTQLFLVVVRNKVVGGMAGTGSCILSEASGGTFLLIMESVANYLFQKDLSKIESWKVEIIFSGQRSDNRWCM